MNDEDAFLRAIQASPNDNTLRLVYADWLDEQNQLGGDFLRLECEFETVPQSDPLKNRLREKLFELSQGVDLIGWRWSLELRSKIASFAFGVPKSGNSSNQHPKRTFVTAINATEKYFSVKRSKSPKIMRLKDTASPLIRGWSASLMIWSLGQHNWMKAI